jgi:heme exporter protein D
LPALDKQKEILSEVKTRNSREKKLMQEAQQEVETARRQVEEMILEH